VRRGFYLLNLWKKMSKSTKYLEKSTKLLKNSPKPPKNSPKHPKKKFIPYFMTIM
jgi:hypothetical protein